jgi:hypothetical protein
VLCRSPTNNNPTMPEASSACGDVDSEAKERDAALFVTDEGNVTMASFFLLMGFPLVCGGRWYLGVTFLIVGLVSALCHAMDQIAEEDKHEIRYNNMNAVDILEELERLERAIKPVPRDKRTDASFGTRNKFLTAMEILAKKANRAKKRKGQYHPHEIECICQEAAYSAFRLFPDDDEIISSALSLHALVAQDAEVRQRHIHEADVYGLNVPINAVKRAMTRAQRLESPPEQLEQRFADLQRKACLLLGALADGDSDLATRVVDEDGLQAVLNAFSWYRYHEDVTNWALWATFILCYDHDGNKKEMIRLGGIQLICQAMADIPDSMEVARHGIATLFDVLRETPESPRDMVRIRQMAVNADLHGAVRNAMDEFPESMEIMMMSQEMLIATGYRGEIPKFHPTS